MLPARNFRTFFHPLSLPLLESHQSVSLSLSLRRRSGEAVSSAVRRSEQWRITRECETYRGERSLPRDVFQDHEQPPGEQGARARRVTGFHRAAPSQ